MSAPTRLVDAGLARDLTATLHRLRQARASGDLSEEIICQRRLDWLIDSRLLGLP